MPYIIFYSLLFLLTGLYYKDKRFDRLYQFFVFVLLVGFSGLRVGLGADYEVYENSYVYLYAESFDAFEPLWQWLILGMRALGLGFHVFLTLIAGITVTLLLYGMRRLSVSYPIGVLFYCLHNIGYVESFNGVRQSLAIMIVFAAFHLLVERRYWHFLGWVIFSCFVHISSLIWIFLLPLLLMRWDWRLMSVALLFSLAIGAPLLGAVGQALASLLPPRYGVYLTREFIPQGQGAVIILIQNSMALLAMISTTLLPKDERGRATTLGTVALAWGIVIYNCTLSFDVAMRFSYNPQMMMFVVLPNLMLLVKDRWIKLLMCAFIVLHAVFLIKNIMLPQSPLHTYSWIFSEYYFEPALW